jgi:hypothetical protein
MNFYKNHFGMIISSVVAICISLIMATSAIFVDKLTFTLPLLIKNWGTAFLVISLTGMAFPLTDWSFALCRKMGLRPETLPHVLVENFVATLFFNTTATIVLTAVNVFHNPEIEAGSRFSAKYSDRICAGRASRLAHHVYHQLCIRIFRDKGSHQDCKAGCG